MLDVHLYRFGIAVPFFIIHITSTMSTITPSCLFLHVPNIEWIICLLSEPSMQHWKLPWLTSSHFFLSFPCSYDRNEFTHFLQSNALSTYPSIFFNIIFLFFLFWHGWAVKHQLARELIKCTYFASSSLLSLHLFPLPPFFSFKTGSWIN